MALIGNYSVLSKSPGRFLAGSTTSVEVGVRSNWVKPGAMRGRLFIDQALTATPFRAEPTGYYPPYTNFIPQASGGLGTSNRLSGNGDLNGSGASGVNIGAGVLGAGVLQALGQLVVSALANLAGSGNMTAADLRGFLLASANLTGSGDLAAAIRATAQAASGLSGAGNISGASAIRASGALSANILSYGELTPEGIRDTVWNAIAAGYANPTTMGGKVNAASAGGVDLIALAAAVRAALETELLQITKVSKIHGIGVPLVVTPTSRVAGDLSQTISTAGDTTTVSAV